MYAARNIDLCSKDCLCLFVCPTGATDTETGQIDGSRCLDGCRLCVDTCPSKAIYLVMDNYPEPMEKGADLTASMLSFLEKKCAQEGIAESIVLNSESKAAAKLARAMQKSCRIVGEDCAREAGYMLPQSKSVRTLLMALQKTADQETGHMITKLLDLL